MYIPVNALNPKLQNYVRLIEEEKQRGRGRVSGTERTLKTEPSGNLIQNQANKFHFNFDKTNRKGIMKT